MSEDKDLKLRGRMLELLSYDPETGIFRWIVNVNSRAYENKIAGSTLTDNSGKKYVKIYIDKKSYFSHRLAWLYIYGSFPKNQIDHIDGDGTNNKISNLRDVDAQTNNKNARLNKRNKSGVSGVFFRKDKMKYEAKIKVNKKTVHVALTNDFFEACCARKSAEIKYGYHENHGSVRPL